MPTKPLNFQTVDKKWEYVYLPSNKMEEGSEESEEPSQKFNKQLQIITKQVPVGNVLDDFTECFEEIVNHINAKRLQAQAFQDDINDPNARVLQIDFAMLTSVNIKMKCEALYGQEEVSTYLFVLYITV